ncbi:MAG: YdcF family protein [Deltaproteobacteria bacterium]|nr:YdcF family protein [Deltaproteobacteria bacterium]
MSSRDGLARRSIFRSFCFLSIMLNLLVGMVLFTPITNVMYDWIELEPQVRKVDAIMLLAAGQHTPTIFGRNTYQRTLKAYALYRQGVADKIIVCGGVQHPGQPATSEGMAQLLMKLGVPETSIFTEITSTNTYENIKNALPIIRKLGVESVLLVTSSYHMRRSLMIAKKLGLNVYAGPVECYEKDIKDSGTRSRFVLEIFREYGAHVYFRLRGWV